MKQSRSKSQKIIRKRKENFWEKIADINAFNASNGNNDKTLSHELTAYIENGAGLLKFNIESNEDNDISLSFFRENTGVLPRA